MLAAVGLLLASLVLGVGSNLARALGPVDATDAPQGAGICDYSELVRDAILANNDDKSYDCDSPTYTDTNQTNGVWGGADADDDSPIDLDLTSATAFAPGKGELDGFRRGARVDLRGTGLGVADLDISKALGTHDGATRTYPNFGDSVKESTTFDSNNDDIAQFVATELGLTFLLDGGSTTSNGLALEQFEGTEGEILWVLFEYGEPHADFKHQTDRDISVWMRVDVIIEHDDTNGDTAGGDSSLVSIMVNSSDPEGTLYAVPFRLPDDSDIEKTESEDISIVWGAAGDFGTANGVPDSTPLTTTGDDPGFTFNQDKFEGSLPRKADEADLTIFDEDTPAVPVQDRQDAVGDRIVDFFTNLSAKNIGVDQLAGKVQADDTPADATNLGLISLEVGKAHDSDEDAVTSISANDLAGLTGLTSLDLSGNEISELPAGLFSEVGVPGDKLPLTTRINLKGEKMGPTGEGFLLDNLGAGGEGLVGGQYLVVERPHKDDRVGFIQGSYEAAEGGALVIDINIRDEDVDNTDDPGIQFLTIAGDTGNLTDPKKGPDVSQTVIDLDDDHVDPGAQANLEAGNYRIAIKLPENDDEDTDNTLHLAYGLLGDIGGVTTLTTVLDIVPVTIRDASYEAPADVPAAPESSFTSVVVTATEPQAPGGSPHLNHNISNLLVTMADGTSANADFLTAYNATGGVTRWGLATSEVVEIETGTLTQFFQRGVLDFHDVGAGYIVERRLAWDYFGGGLGGSTNQGVEPVPETAPEGGVQVGAFGHYVANVDADGNETGFLDLFNALGGVDSFGFPKTGARVDTGADGTLSQENSIGLVRQYFQAAVFQITPGTGLAELTLLGDDLRDVLVPGWEEEAAFAAVDSFLSVGDEVSPPVISS
jgi:hypothetical protein